MGSFVGFMCKFCQYQEPSIGLGFGKAASPFLALYRCHHCNAIGSTWIHENKTPLCSQCYDEALTILPDDTRYVNCPKCGEQGMIVPKEGSW